MFLLELHHGLFSDSFDLEAPRHDGWRLITPCDRNLPRNDPRGKDLVYQQAYFDAIDTENIQFIDAQGGKHGFLKFV